MKPNKSHLLLLLVSLFILIGEPAVASGKCAWLPEKNKEEEFNDCDEQFESISKCGGLSHHQAIQACVTAKEADKAAVAEIDKAFADICKKIGEMETSIANACKTSQESCHAKSESKAAELKAAVDKYESLFNKRVKDLEGAKADLAAEIGSAKRFAKEKIDDKGKDCREKVHQRDPETADIKRGENIESVGTDGDNLVIALKNGLPVNPIYYKGLQQRQAQTLVRINNSIKQVQTDIAKLRSASIAAGRFRDQNNSLKKNLGQPTPQEKPSTITGNTNKNDMPQQAGGAPPPSGGGGGGGQPQQSPSTLTEQARPASGADYPEVARDGPGSGQTTDDPNAGSAKLAERNGPEGNGIVDISKISNKSFEPRERKGSREGRGGSGKTLAKGELDPIGGEKKDKSANPADGKVDGSGAAGGGIGSASEKDKKEVAARSEGSENGNSFNGAGGVSAGGSTDESFAAFGKPLGDPKFSLAGSDTDAQIKQMVGSFDRNNSPGESGRELASAEGEDGIGDKNGPSLFERCHETHNRCQLKGCVTTHGGRKGV